ncbi:hypothetical protein ACOME3_008156 [Neoechinorhynchus agilis]
MSSRPPLPPVQQPPNLLCDSPDDPLAREAVLEMLSAYFKKSQLQLLEAQLTQVDSSAALSGGNQRSGILNLQNFRPRFRRSSTSTRPTSSKVPECQTIDPALVFRLPLSQFPLTDVRHPSNGTTLTIPDFFQKLCSRLLSDQQKEGIFRLAGSYNREKVIMASIADQNYCFDSCGTIDLAAVAKRFIRNIPGGLIPEVIRGLMVDCIDCVILEKPPRLHEQDVHIDQAVLRSGGFTSRIRAKSPVLRRRNSTANRRTKDLSDPKLGIEDRLMLLCLLMPKLNRDLLVYLLTVLMEVSKAEDRNKMSISNLIIVFAPTIFDAECSSGGSVKSASPTNARHCVDKPSKVLTALLNNSSRIGTLIPCLQEKLKQIRQRKLEQPRKSRILSFVTSGFGSGFGRSRRRSRSTAGHVRVGCNPAENATNSSFIRRALKLTSSQMLNPITRGTPSPSPSTMSSVAFTSQTTSSVNSFVGRITVDEPGEVKKTSTETSSILRRCSSALDKAMMVEDIEDSSAVNDGKAPLKRTSAVVEVKGSSLLQNKDDGKSSDTDEKVACTPAKRPSFKKSKGRIVAGRSDENEVATQESMERQLNLRLRGKQMDRGGGSRGISRRRPRQNIIAKRCPPSPRCNSTRLYGCRWAMQTQPAILALVGQNVPQVVAFEQNAQLAKDECLPVPSNGRQSRYHTNGSSNIPLRPYTRGAGELSKSPKGRQSINSNQRIDRSSATVAITHEPQNNRGRRNSRRRIHVDEMSQERSRRRVQQRRRRNIDGRE